MLVQSRFKLDSSIDVCAHCLPPLIVFANTQCEIQVSDATTGDVVAPFPSRATDDDGEETRTPLDEIFVQLAFDYTIVKSECIELELIQSILDLILANLRLLDTKSLVAFCQDALEKKGRDSAKRAARSIVMLMEICSGEALYASASPNMNNVKGVRVDRGDGVCRVWTITKMSFDDSTAPILAAIMTRIDTEFSKSIVPTLGLNDIRKIKSGLGDIKIGHTQTKSAYFITNLSPTPLPLNDDGVSPITSLSFSYQAYSVDKAPVGVERAISWRCSRDQAKSIMDLMKTLVDKGLRGDVVETCSLDYILKMCNVLDTCIDSFKLGALIDKVNGIRAESNDDGAQEEAGDDVGDEAQEDGTEPITPYQLRRMLMEQIEGESEPVRYDFGEKRVNTEKTTREQNGLGAMARVSTILAAAKEWLKPFGSHFHPEYSKYLKTKFATEFKSFLSNRNSVYRYIYI